MEKDANKHWNTTLHVCKLKTVACSLFLWLQLYIFYPGQYLRVIVWCTTYGVLEGFRHINKDIREVKHHVYVKWQTRIYTMWPSFLSTCRLLFIISTPKLVVSRNFLSIRTVLSCFYLLIFYLEKFSTKVWRLRLRIREA